MSSQGEWLLEPGLDFLNHGSFGACPRSVRSAQDAWRDRLERDPVDFFLSVYPTAYAEARDRAACWLNAPSEGFVFVRNATSGINTALNALDLSPGDEIWSTDHEYGACVNAARERAEQTGAELRIASIPWPLEDPEQVLAALAPAFESPSARALLFSWITSPTGLIFPVDSILQRCRERGIVSILDAAHGPGQVAMDLVALQPDFATGNFHKWCCAPKGCAFLWVDGPHRERTRPSVISHGASTPVPDSGPWTSRFELEFAWCGTDDVTPWLSLPAALDWLQDSHPNGATGRMNANRQLCLQGRRILLEQLEVSAPAPESMVGSLAAVPLPDGEGPPGPLQPAPLQVALRTRDIQVPIGCFPRPPRRFVRISAQAYNQVEQYGRLATALQELIAAERPRPP